VEVMDDKGCGSGEQISMHATAKIKEQTALRMKGRRAEIFAFSSHQIAS
jgi:hypothetical protein